MHWISHSIKSLINISKELERYPENCPLLNHVGQESNMSLMFRKITLKIVLPMSPSPWMGDVPKRARPVVGSSCGNPWVAMETHGNLECLSLYPSTGGPPLPASLPPLCFVYTSVIGGRLQWWWGGKGEKREESLQGSRWSLPRAASGLPTCHPWPSSSCLRSLSNPPERPPRL